MAFINSVGIGLSGSTGTGTFVGSTSPTLITPALGTPSAVILTNGTGLPISTGVSGLGTNVATFLATPSSANLAAAITDETGTGSLVFATSPTFITPALGTPSSGNLANCTGYPSGSISGIVPLANGGTGSNLSATGGASQVLRQSSGGANVTVSQLAASDLSNGVTGSGAVVLATSPTLVTPALGVPSSVTLTNGTGLPISTGVSGLAAGIATFLGTPSSANLAAAVTDETGTGALVFANTPTLVTPNIGAATGTSLSLSAAASLTMSGLHPVVTVKSQIFNASGTYTPSTGMLYAEVTCVGGGGGSGGCGATGIGTASNAGAGGGGAKSMSLLTAATVGASQTVTIGAGGSAGASGANAGGTGGDTSLGTLIIAKGGVGGSGDSAAGTPKNGANCGAGGSAAAGTGDLKVPGGSGTIGGVFAPNNQFGSTGGGSSYAPALSPISAGPAPIAGGSNTGQGATGGTLAASSGAIAGAAGGSGIVYIIEYCNQ